MLARLEDTIRSEMERSKLTGLAIALLKGGEVVDAAGYGIASIETSEPVGPETVFSIMSVTKTIVATAIMQLRDQGMFQLDDPANSYLAPVSIKNQWEDESPVTIRQLLTHTAGLPVGIGAEPEGKRTLEEYVDLVCRTERRPGEAIVYANWGYDALGVLVERFSGCPVDQYVRDKVFAPLGMTDSVLGEPIEGTPLATGHYVSSLDGSRHTLPLPEWSTTPASPEGGCLSTVLDLARFLLAHLHNGTPILAPETTWEMHRVHAAQAAYSGMGLGFRVTRSNNERKTICHGGDGGGFTAFICGYPRARAGVALLINTGGMQVARSVIANTALRLLSEPHRHSFAGTAIVPGFYRSTFWDIEVEVRDGEPPTLTTTDGLVVADEAGVSALTPVAEGRYEGEDGMFHGFEVAFEDGDEPAFSGGVYPFAFVRVGDIPREQPIDEGAGLIGEWRGSVRTPMGPLAIMLRIESETTAELSTPLGTAALENFCAEGGHVEMEFPLSFPGVGDFRNFVRLECKGKRLTGKTYARSKFGENVMRTELDRA